MNKKEIEKLLKKDGWVITHGKAHDQAINPSKPGVKIPIPIHKSDIPIGTANSILKSAGLK